MLLNNKENLNSIYKKINDYKTLKKSLKKC